MAKIPHMEFGNRPSAAVGVPALNTSAGDIASGVSGLLEIGLRRSAADEAIRQKAEAAEEAKRQEALDAKQKIVDTITAGRMGNDFESQSMSVIETLQQQYVDEPEKAIDAYVKEMNSRADEFYRSAPNPAVEQRLATDTQNVIGTGQRAVFAWATTRQTQKAKTDVDNLLGSAAAKAEKVADYRQLGGFMNAEWTRLSSHAEMAFGGRSAEKKQKFQEDSAMAWVNYNVVENPRAVESALDSGALDNFIPVEERKRIRSDAKRGFEALAETQEYDLLKDASEKNNKYVNMYMSGTLTAGDIWNERKRLEVQRAAVASDPKFMAGGKLTAAGQNQLKIVDKQMATIDALNNFYMKSRDKGMDNDDVVAELQRFQDGLFGKDAGDNREDLQAWSDQQARLFKARGDGKISKGTFDSMYKELALAYPAASGAAAGETGGFWADIGWKRRTSRQSGVTALNKQIDAEGQDFTPKDKAAAYLWYSRFITEALQTGDVTEKQAQSFALKAYNIVAGNKAIGVSK